MNDMLDVPAERDLPAGRARQMRSDLLAATRPPTRRGLVLGLTAAAAAVALIISLAVRPPDEPVHLVALSATELTPSLREQIDEKCLDRSGPDLPTWPDVDAGDVSIAVRQDDQVVVVFLTDTAYFTCDWSSRDGGLGGGSWRSRDWLPGPVQPLTMSSTDLDGGEVVVAGRVSAGTDRIVLDHGDGRTSAGRIENGVFGLFSDGPATSRAALVTYRSDGAETGRLRVFPSDGSSPLEPPGCYVDPSGTVVHGEGGPDCRPAQRWAR